MYNGADVYAFRSLNKKEFLTKKVSFIIAAYVKEILPINSNPAIYRVKLQPLHFYR